MHRRRLITLVFKPITNIESKIDIPRVHRFVIRDRIFQGY
jgi:hypothetical protein